MSACPPQEQLAALLNNLISASQRAETEHHVAACAVCRVTLERLRTAGATLVDETAVHVPSPRTADTLGWSAAASQPSSSAPLASPAIKLEVPGYELLEELGRGGMGVVYKARQLSLNRLVALKMIRSAALADSDQLARFKIEAEALAQLQHAHIVQVFEIGEHDDMPYLSMEYVGGSTLAEALTRRAYAFHAAAELIEQLSRAMFSAHQRGILHRDLKPANVLLTSEGEPKITDFGLAKRVTSESQLTVADTVMGTPSYMPPEQAQGRLLDVGPRSDVYALGAMLYEMLTGRPPFRGTTPLETIQQVIQREVVAPRTLSPRVPRDLETICLKCLSKQPSQRYETAADLADDLRRFTRNEPILARRIGPVGRVWRWCQRNPALATAVALVLLVVIVGSSGMAWQRRQTAQARVLAQQQFDRFTAESDEKLQLIQDLLERIPEEERAQDQRLQSALASYEAWLAEEPADEAARSKYADALSRVAEIRRRVGQFELAQPVYHRALDAYRQLVASAPEAPQHQRRLALTLNWLGENLRESGQLSEAIARYDEALAQQEALIKHDPDESAYDGDIARSLYNRALARRELNQSDEAEADLRRAIELLESSSRRGNSNAENRQDLARSHINLGVLLRATDRATEAEKHYLPAIDLLRELQGEFPDTPDYAFELATALMNLANLYLANLTSTTLTRDQPLLEAEQNYRSSVEILRKLVAKYGNVPRYRRELANSLNGFGAVLTQQQKSDEAKQAWEEGIQELKTLVERSAGVAEYYRLLALLTHNLAYLQRHDPDVAPRERLLRQAIAYQTKATELSPSNALYTSTLRTYERTLARVLKEAAKPLPADAPPIQEAKNE